MRCSSEADSADTDNEVELLDVLFGDSSRWRTCKFIGFSLEQFSGAFFRGVRNLGKFGTADAVHRLVEGCGQRRVNSSQRLVTVSDVHWDVAVAGLQNLVFWGGS